MYIGMFMIDRIVFDEPSYFSRKPMHEAMHVRMQVNDDEASHFSKKVMCDEISCSDRKYMHACGVCLMKTSRFSERIFYGTSCFDRKVMDGIFYFGRKFMHALVHV